MKQYIQKLIHGRPLTEEEMSAVFELLLTEEPTSAQIGAFLYALGARFPTVDEIVGAVRVLRAHTRHVDLSSIEGGANAIDTAGTGGSGLSAFNTSTVVAFIVAAHGSIVVKHGNRAQTSHSGSADVLEALGMKIELSPDQVRECIRQTGFGFLYAPAYHQATKRVQLIRKELGFRTIFGFLGPLTNPAGVRRQLFGVSERKMLDTLAEATQRLGCDRVVLAAGSDGLDEVTLTGETVFVEVSSKRLTRYELTPRDFGLPARRADEIRGFAPKDSASMVHRILAGEEGALRDLVLINSSVALYVAGATNSPTEGVAIARSMIDSGQALACLENVVKTSQVLQG